MCCRLVTEDSSQAVAVYWLYADGFKNCSESVTYCCACAIQFIYSQAASIAFERMPPPERPCMHGPQLPGRTDAYSQCYTWM